MHKDTKAKEPEFYIKKLPNNWTMLSKYPCKLKSYEPEPTVDHMNIYLKRLENEWNRNGNTQHTEKPLPAFN